MVYSLVRTTLTKIWTKIQLLPVKKMHLKISSAKQWSSCIETSCFISHITMHACHYIDGIMTTMASQITSLTIVYSTVYSDADQRKHQILCVTGLCVGNSPGPVNSPHKGPVTRKMFPFDDVIMWLASAVFALSTYNELAACRCTVIFHHFLQNTVTMGQRRKVTAVAFFRCPTVTVVVGTPWSDSLVV